MTEGKISVLPDAPSGERVSAVSKLLKGGLQDCARTYQRQISRNPLKTKCFTSAVIAGLGSILSQVLRKTTSIAELRAFIIYGGLVSGPITHYFYILLEKLFGGPGLFKYVLRLLTDRLMFSPTFLVVTLYTLSWLNRIGHPATVQSIKEKYWPCLLANWKIWTIPQIINIGFIPVQYRVLFANFVALVWNTYLAAK